MLWLGHTSNSAALMKQGPLRPALCEPARVTSSFLLVPPGFAQLQVVERVFMNSAGHCKTVAGSVVKMEPSNISPITLNAAPPEDCIFATPPTPVDDGTH